MKTEMPTIATDTIKELLDALIELKPLLSGESGAYLGQYEGPSEKICSIMGWEYKSESKSN